MIPNEVIPALIDGPTLVSNTTPILGQAAPAIGGKTWHMLALERLILDPDMQPREMMSRSLIAAYATLYTENNATVLPPIVVYQEGSDYWVADGFHRIAAAERAGLAALPADLRPGTRREALLYACSANKHGKPLTHEDKRRVVRRLLEDEEWRQWTDSAIARHCGVHQTFVSKLRRTLNSGLSEQASRTYRTKHGTVGTMDTRHRQACGLYRVQNNRHTST